MLVCAPSLARLCSSVLELPLQRMAIEGWRSLVNLTARLFARVCRGRVGNRPGDVKKRARSSTGENTRAPSRTGTPFGPLRMCARSPPWRRSRPRRSACPCHVPWHSAHRDRLGRAQPRRAFARTLAVIGDARQGRREDVCADSGVHRRRAAGAPRGSRLAILVDCAAHGPPRAVALGAS